MERDENYVPYTRSSYKLPDEKTATKQDYDEIFEETPIYTLYRMFIMQGLWVYFLLLNLVGNWRCNTKAAGGFTLRMFDMFLFWYVAELKLYFLPADKIQWDPLCILLEPTTSILTLPCSRKTNVITFFFQRGWIGFKRCWICRLLHLYVEPWYWLHGLDSLLFGQRILLLLLPHSVLGRLALFPTVRP